MVDKGSQRRPPQITHAEEELRWLYATQPMSFEEYRRKMKALLKRQEQRR